MPGGAASGDDGAEDDGPREGAAGASVIALFGGDGSGTGSGDAAYDAQMDKSDRKSVV